MLRKTPLTLTLGVQLNYELISLTKKIGWWKTRVTFCKEFVFDKTVSEIIKYYFLKYFSKFW